MSEERAIPEARLRPRGAGDQARAAGADGARWLGKRARGLGRVARGVALASCMLVPAVLIGTLRTDYRSPSSYDFDQDMQRLQRTMDNLERMRLDNDALLRSLDVSRMLQDSQRYVPVFDPSAYDLDPSSLDELTAGFPASSPVDAELDRLRAILDQTAAAGAGSVMHAEAEPDSSSAPPAPVRASRPGHDLPPER